MTEPTPRHSSGSRRPAIVRQLARPSVQLLAAITALVTVVILWGLFTLPGGLSATPPADAPDDPVIGNEPGVNVVEDPTVTVALPCTVGAYTTGTVDYERGPVLERWNTSTTSLLGPSCPQAQTTSADDLAVSDVPAGGGCVILNLESVTFCLDLGPDDEVSRLSVNVADSDPFVVAAARKLLAATLDPTGLRRGGLGRAWPNKSDRLCTVLNSDQLKWSEFQHPDLPDVTTLIIERC